MNPYHVRYFDHLSVGLPFDKLDMDIKQSPLALEQLNCVNWTEYPYKPDAAFKLAALKDGLYLYFKVTENHCLGRFTIDGSPVYKDSCIEFFIDPLNNGEYYNFEFNCIGTMLMGYGNSRYNREPAPAFIMSNIRRKSSLGNIPIVLNSEISWELQVTIPFEAFFKYNINSLSKQPFRFNVYKCGNETNTPHYITWKLVKTERPDFHRPEYFGNAFVL